MCLGIPSISTDCPCGGPRELIEDGVNGYLIPVGDEEALADRLRRILSDEEGAERMGKQAALLLEEYRPERVNAEWKDYLLGCAARQGECRAAGRASRGGTNAARQTK